MLNPIEPSKSQQRVVSVHHTLAENANLESDNPFRSRTIAILINDTMTKSLDHVSCADCIRDQEFPAHEPTTTNNCNPIFGRRFRILLEYNNEATFCARTVRNCKLMHLCSMDIQFVALRTNYQQNSAILDNLLSFGFLWRIREILTNYLLAKSRISYSLTYATSKITETAQCY